MPLMKIFNALEIEAFESPPLFNHIERKKFFTLPAQLQQLSQSLRTPTNQACFTLMAGYFRARYKFFGKSFRPADLGFVATRLGVNPLDILPDTYDQQTTARHRQLLLDFFGYRRFDAESGRRLARELANLAQAQLRPKVMLLEGMQWLLRHRVALPGYTTLASLVGQALYRHKRRLLALVDTHLTPKQRQRLDALLEKDTDVAVEVPLRIQRYRLTLLKKFHQSTKPARIKANLADWQLLEALYQEMESVIRALGLSPDALSYYAHAVIKAQIFQVTRRAAADRYLHLLAFIAHQTLRLQDILVDTFLLCVQTMLNTTQRAHKEQYYQERTQRHQLLSELLTGLDQSLLMTFTTIQQILADSTFSAAEKVAQIAQVLEQQAPAHQRVTAQVRALQHTVESVEPDHEYYVLLGKHSLRLQNRVAEIVRLGRFDQRSSASALYKAIAYYQDRGGELDRRVPTEFLSAQEHALAFTPNGSLHVSLYKVLLFVHIANAIKAGTLNLQLSHKYRSLEEYLIPKEQWITARTEYLQRTNLLRFMHGHLTLRELRRTLDDQYRREYHGSARRMSPVWIEVV